MIKITKTVNATYENHARAMVYPSSARYSVLKDNVLVAFIHSSDSRNRAFSSTTWVVSDANTNKIIKSFHPRADTANLYRKMLHANSMDRNNNVAERFTKEDLAFAEKKSSEIKLTAFESAKAYAREYYS